MLTLVAAVFAVWSRYRSKARLYEALAKKSDELAEAKLMIEERNQELTAMNETLEDKVNDRTKRLNESFQNLLISNQRLDHFTYKSAHDLKGPISSILGLTNLLQLELNGSGNKATAEYIEMVKDTSLKMDQLLKRIIQSSQLNQTVINKSHFLIEDLLKQMTDLIGLKRFDHEVVVTYELSDKHAIFSDAAVLQVILRYLVNNSLQYFDHRKSKHEIIFRTAYDELNYYIHVLDNGKGIDPLLIPDLFKMFSKGGNEAMNPGLGLYDANLLVEKIGGTVTFDETDVRYTHFIISFPYQ